MKTYELREIDDPTLIYHIVANLSYHDQFLQWAWCRKTFGEANDLRFGGRWNFASAMLYFKNSEDRTMFLLRWG